MALLNLLEKIGAGDDLTLRQALEQNHGLAAYPCVIASGCTTRKKSGERCQVCSALCPTGHIDFVWKQEAGDADCIRCGICAANCPDRCILPASSRAESFLTAVCRDRVMEISCREDERIFSFTVSCVAGLSWEQLALAVLKNGLVISLAACGGCNQMKQASQIQRNLEQLRFFLGDDLFSERVTILENGEHRLEGTAMSRRQLIDSVRNSIQIPDPDSEILLENATQSTIGLMYRELLRDQVKEFSRKMERSARPKFRMRLPEFTENCFACESCVKACPRAALSFSSDGEYVLAVVEPWRCTGCGMCVSACPSEGVRKPVAMQLRTLHRVVLKKIALFRCADCGNPRRRDAADGLCSLCRSKRANERMRRP